MSGSDAGTSMIPALVQTIFREALEQGVAEIHAEPRPGRGVIRFREHGELREHTSLNPLTYSEFVNHMKALCAEQIVPDDPRLPQTGRLSLMIDESAEGPLEISLQTLPVHGGEKLLLRILQADSRDWTLDDLGFSAANLTLYREAIARPTGMIIHAGPTGSGKTTSLYAAVGALDLARKSATSVEWALERIIPDLNQHVVNRDIGGSFADSLRSIMRQSPDIVLVGKLEDTETVDLALGLAAGALVFGSIHTSDGASTLTRFTDMGMESFLVSSAVRLVCAQRLIRMLCDCKEPRPPTEAERLLIRQALGEGEPVDSLFRTVGCKSCNDGYGGLIGVQEIFIQDEEISALVVKGTSPGELRQVARRRGMRTLFQDAMTKVLEGKTTVEEALHRVPSE